MTHTGFVLAGGASSRMGRDKAFLPYRGTTLLEHMAGAVLDAAGNVAILGEPARFTHLGYPVFPDKSPGLGPLGGLLTALSITETDWNLVVACDMPGITAPSLRILLKRSDISTADCVAAASFEGSVEPLCAVYHRRCLPLVARAVKDRQLKMFDLLAELRVDGQILDPAALANANTPAEWAELQNEPK
jgi:molybdenum cofactor guanylyltransferase